MPIRCFIVALAIPLATPALAHPGGHQHLSLGEALAHLAEPFHAGVLVAAVVAVAVVYKLTQRHMFEARRKAQQDRQHHD